MNVRHKVFALCSGLLLTACNGTALAPTQGPPAYSTTASITSIPGVPPATGTWSFDIGFVDQTAHQYYLADRTTNGVDVLDSVTGAFLRTAGAGTFAGNKSGGVGGPNGVAPVGNGLVYAGDGNTTLKVVDANSGALVFTSPVLTNPFNGPAIPNSQCPNGAQGTFRTDEVAFDSTDKVFLAINDLACPPFGTFFSTANPAAPVVVGRVSFPTALTLTTTTPNTPGGVEQPLWDPTQDVFLVAIPGTLANPNGEIDVISPKTFQITKIYSVPTNCQPNGLALGNAENLYLGCSATTGTLQTIVMNATNGSIIATIPGVAGGDEVWFNPIANRFYCACSNNPTSAGGPMLLVVDALTNTVFQQIPTSGGAHSVAVDASVDKIFVAERPANAANGVYSFSH